MKSILALLALVSAPAFACPDISGNYVTADGLYLKFVQESCTTLHRYLGEVADDGSVSFPAEGMEFPLNGKPNCGIRDFCTTATALPDVLKFETNYDAFVNTDSHGSCYYRAYTLSLNSTGGLVGQYAVFNCTDKFTGTAAKTFNKM